MSILVIIPTRRDLDAELAYRSFLAEDAMRAKCGHVDIVRVFDRVCGRGLVLEHLGDQHSHVMWIPDDVVVYDPLLPGLLVQKDPAASIAPQVKPQGVKGDSGAGLVEVNIMSACYIVPADEYRIAECSQPKMYCDMSLTVWTHNSELVEKVAEK
ncbi:hypothetical protein DRQ25_18055 [Candidatus Fermentibacteria bacterium]|nr:MAG: hypothetical protein DRQ25_18055 [Candidatus Fermentibacteria bacterium]